MSTAQTLTLATRESRLALAQSEWVAAQLRAFHPGLTVNLLGMTTQGDQILDKPLNQIGGKGLFIKELEVAMTEGRADLAVHSMKDVPMVLPEGFALVVVGAREEVRDAFVSNRHASLEALPRGAVVGTSSLRRMSLLRHQRPDLAIESLRGNVNTRLRKLDDGHYDAIILAAAGLRRLGLEGRIRALLPLEQFLPAIAQGALGIEYPAARTDVAAWLAPFAQADTTALVTAERAFGRALLASCDVPLGALARMAGGRLLIEGFIASPDGAALVRDRVEGDAQAAAELGHALATKLLDAGGRAILDALPRAHG
ncbi:MAG: hydroxymethylbilane synthase [Betaproteobacteria bacterium]|nr:hydroxymethylbilane synthase [Betaproteobacteria bacterium]